MKNIYSPLFLFILCGMLGCKKDMDMNVIAMPDNGIEAFSASANTVVLSSNTDASRVVTFSFKAPDFGVAVVPSYTLQFDVPSDTTGAEAWGKAINVKLEGDSLSRSFTGADLNSMLVNQMELPVDEPSTLVVRLKAEVNQNTGAASTIKPLYSTLKMTVTPYRAIVIYPALLVKGGNGWKTPADRTEGFFLSSAKFNSKYEGYLDLPNADGYGGDALQLVSTVDGKSYGWGTDANTMSVGGGPLWFTPAPAYMKVNADLDAMTIKYTPVKFYISGDDNGWSTSATPMTYNPANKSWEAKNVALTAGKTFVFTCNGSYDISYKVDAKGALFFAGAPNWGGINIPVEKTGVYTVTLNLSEGDGNYTYTIK